MNKITGLIQNWIETKATQEEMRYIKGLLDNRIVPEVHERMDEVIAFLREGQKLAAVKLYKDITGMGLKEAKDAVDIMGEEMKRLKTYTASPLQALQNISSLGYTNNTTGVLTTSTGTPAIKYVDPYSHLTNLSDQYKLMKNGFLDE